MKKAIAFILITTMLLMTMGCGAKEETPQVDVKEAIEILDTVWATYAEDEMFAAVGGDYDNMVDGAPGVVNLSIPENVDSLLGLPQDTVTKVDDCASLIHMMNANTFTAGVYHVTDSADVETVVGDIKENLSNRQWMCGFPEKLVIVTVGDYVVSAFGNGEIIDTFKTKLMESYEATVISVEENLVG